MKKTTKTLGLLLVMAVIVSACKKQSIDAPETQQQGELHEVSFRVKSFKQEIVPIASLTAQGGENNLDESIHMIQYVVYDHQGKHVKGYVQYQTDPSFGTLSLTLNEGDYKIIAWATSGEVYYNDSPTTELYFKSFSALGHISNFDYTKNAERLFDSFYTKMDFSVTGPESSNELILERQTAKVELRINDVLPEFSQNLAISYNTVTHFYVTPFMAFYEQFHTTFWDLEQFSTDNQHIIPFYVISDLPNETFTTDITLNFQNDSGGMIHYQIVEGIEVYRNKKTILTGTLSPSENSTSGFSISIDTSWEDIHREFTF